MIGFRLLSLILEKRALFVCPVTMLSIDVTSRGPEDTILSGRSVYLQILALSMSNRVAYSR